MIFKKNKFSWLSYQWKRTENCINEKGLKTALYTRCCQKFVPFSVDILINIFGPYHLIVITYQEKKKSPKHF